jgi:hypothetical protein
MPQTPPPYLQTSLLWHTTPAGSHYDWLLQTPCLQGLETDTLTTFRLHLPPSLWSPKHPIPLTPLTPHRKIYLTFQGPVSSQRGFVLRANHGIFTPLSWSDSQITLQITWQQFPLCARCTLTRRSTDAWSLSIGTFE